MRAQAGFDLAVWVNTSKNPRLKAVELASLQMVVEIPKQIALANLALRVQHREKVRVGEVRVRVRYEVGGGVCDLMCMCVCWWLYRIREVSKQAAWTLPG